jgi:hypothetical protein
MSAAAAYARSVQEALERWCGGPTVLSPRDWALVDRWFRRGIPLALVLECLEDDARRPRRSRRPAGSRLAHLAARIEEAGSVVAAGLRAPLAVAAGPSTEGARDAWRAARDRASPASALRALLNRLLAGMERGTENAALDAELEAGLLDAVGPERVQAVGLAVDLDLAPFSGAWSEDTLERTRRSAIVERLRREIGLPRLGVSASRRGPATV